MSAAMHDEEDCQAKAAERLADWQAIYEGALAVGRPWLAGPDVTVTLSRYEAWSLLVYADFGLRESGRSGSGVQAAQAAATILEDAMDLPIEMIQLLQLGRDPRADVPVTAEEW